MKEEEEEGEREEEDRYDGKRGFRIEIGIEVEYNLSPRETLFKYSQLDKFKYWRMLINQLDCVLPSATSRNSLKRCILRPRENLPALYGYPPILLSTNSSSSYLRQFFFSSRIKHDQLSYVARGVP